MRSVHTHAYKAFLKRLLAARERTGLTQGEVARQLRVPQSRLSRMESGERRIDVIELAELAQLYGKPLSHFVPVARTDSGGRRK
jgi:transcriptional regulator with XRE-family HTH domain